MELRLSLHPATRPRDLRNAQRCLQCSRDRGDPGRRPGRPPVRDRSSGAEQPIQLCKGIRVILCAQSRIDIQSARRSELTRSPRTAEVRRSIKARRCRQPSGPRNSRSSRAPRTLSDPCQSSSLNAACLCPVFDDSSVGRFCLRPQIIWFFIEWSRQKPEILFVSFFILLDGDEGIIEIIC